jgi:hypothetical protein
LALKISIARFEEALRRKEINCLKNEKGLSHRR